MARLFQPGTYQVAVRERAVYQNDKGSLIFACRYEGDAPTPQSGSEPHEITGYHTLAKPDGTLSESTIETLKEVFGWDGCDPFWLADTDLGRCPAEIVVENYTKNDGSVGVSVKWLNKPGGGHGGMPQNGDRNAIMAKFGARFRALSGGQSRPRPQAMPRPQTQPKPQAAPAQAPAAPQMLPFESQVTPCDMNTAWGAFCQAAGDGRPQQEMHRMWFACLQALTGKTDPNQCTDQDWGKVAAGCDEWIGQQLPM